MTKTPFAPKAAITALTLTGLLALPHATLGDTNWNAGNVGLWGSGGNWNNGVPGSPDNNARINNGGTANVTVGTPAINSGSVVLRMNDNGANTANVVNWNPSSSYIFNQIWVGNNLTGTAAFNHDSGTIRADNSWFLIGRQGNATYTMTGNSVIQADDRITIGERNVGTDAYLIMSGSSRIDGQHANASNNEYFVGADQNGHGTVIMNDSASADVPQWTIGNNNGAQGTIIMNNSSRNTVEFETRIGRNGTAQGTIEMNGGAVWTNNRGFGASQENNRESLSTITMNDNTRMTVNSWFELGGGQSTFTLNGTSQLDANGNVRIGMRSSAIQQASVDANDGISRLILNDNSRFRGEGGDFYIGLSTDSAGLVQVNDTARLTDDGTLAIGSDGAGTLEINGTGEVTLGSWAAVGQRVNGNGAGGTINMTGGSLTIGADLHVGMSKTGTLNISGGTLDVGNVMFLARDHQTQVDSTASVVNQSGGTVIVGNYLHLEQATTTGGEGTYNLTGGTLRVNDLRMGNGAGQGDFNWTTGGTLTMQEPNVGQSGIGGGGLGGAGAGTTMVVDTNGGTLSTGNGAVLDLGDLYQNFGNNFDTVAVTGDLNLTGVGDVLDFWDNVNLIRPGGNSTATGEYQLISVTGTVTGQFDTIIGPEALGQFFQFYQTGATGVPLGTSADTLRRNTGYIDYRADGLYFVYKVGGQIPEPQTTAFLFLGVALLRGFAVMKRNKKLREDVAA